MSNEQKQCEYILRQGKSKGSQCVHKVSRKDPQGLRCSSHYNRFASDSSSPKESGPAPEPEKLSPIIDLKRKEIEGEILSEEIEKEFKERFAKEKKEMFYHKWRRHQFNNRLN